MTIWNVPIESLEERYSSQWGRWFHIEFTRLGIEYRAIPGIRLTDKITKGSFLDICGTNYFKANQLKVISSLMFEGQVKDGDIFLFHDLWFPGIEMLAYMRDGLGIDFKICGILHAGTYDPYDFLSKKGMAKWGEKLEESWFRIADMIFVATQWHRHLLYSNRIVEWDKIKVTGLPIYFDFAPNELPEKENIIVFPHRLDEEKNPQLFDLFQTRFQEDKSIKDSWQFLKTMEHWKGKKGYYDMLSRSKIVVSFADQETWGIAMQEALFLGCFPVIPDRLSYTEMYEPMFRYSSYAEAMTLIKYGMEKYESKEVQDTIRLNKEKLIGEGKDAIRRMICEMEMMRK